MPDTYPQQPMSKRQQLLKDLSNLNVRSYRIGQAYTEGETVTIIIDSDFIFHADSTTFAPHSGVVLKKIAKILNTFKTTNITVSAYTDNTGDDAYLKALSLKQAQLIEDALWTYFHVDTRLIAAFGFGPMNPIAQNNTAYWRSQNRRIVIRFQYVPNDDL